MNNLLYICFNRPDLVKKTLPPILSAGWDNITILCDGPRNTSDMEAISQVKKFVLSQISEGDDRFNLVFRKVNMGCRRNIEDGLNFFFKEFGQGWVFEDDILLTRIGEFIELRARNLKGHVSLYNYLPCSNIDLLHVTNGHFFIWGWYLNNNLPINFKLQPSLYLFFKLIRTRGLYKGVRIFLTYIRTLLNMTDTWDSIYRCWAILNDIDNKAVGISFIENIGFDSRATHTTGAVITPCEIGNYRTSSEWNKALKAKSPTYLA